MREQWREMERGGESEGVVVEEGTEYYTTKCVLYSVCRDKEGGREKGGAGDWTGAVLDHSRGRFFSAGRRKNIHMPPISILSADMRRMGGFDGITTCLYVCVSMCMNMYVHR